MVAFDDERAVANAGVMLPALLARRLGIEALVDERVDLGDRPGAANAGPQGDDDGARRWRWARTASRTATCCASGQTAAVLGHRVAAPSTLGTFLRAFTFGHVRQLDRVLAESA